MNRKEKILRVRPFNMANFSSGSGVLGFLSVIISFYFILPAAFFVWTGFAVTLKTSDGKIDYDVLVRRLNRVLLPICIAIFLVLLISLIRLVGFSYFNLTEVLLLFWVTLHPPTSLFLAARLSASRLKALNFGGFTKGEWLLKLLLYALLSAIIGVISLSVIDRIMT